ncbi:hypothetical protein CROQUDRAFT_24207, partial [Cronartium quercuum f. sp. fusiforme G11]
DPAAYCAHGCGKALSTEIWALMLALVQREPALFLDEICDQIFDETGIWVSISTVHWELMCRLALTLKK